MTLELVLSITATIFWTSGIFSLVTFLIFMGVVLLGGFISFLQVKINELSQTVEKHSVELKKFKEKFKIHDRLNKLEVKVFNG